MNRTFPLLFLGVTLLLAVIIVNPFRETLAQDDAWAYARMVQHTLATGRYKIHPFTVVNLPVHTYLAAALARLFGYSLVLLRCITLVFLLLALRCFYLLLREFGHTRQLAGLMTLVFLASPLVLMLSFDFMTDIPFVAWMLLALVLWVRGLRRESAWTMFLGSLAAGCAIGTRQFGMALVAGPIAAWLLSRSATRPPLRLILAAIPVPLFAAIAQIYLGMAFPDYMQTLSFQSMHAFYRSSPLVLFEELFWRCSIITQYLGMGLLPLLPFALGVRRSFWKERLGPLPLWLLALLSCALIVFALTLSSFHSARPLARHRGLWEPLELEWILPVNFEHARPLMRLLDLAGILGGGVLVAVVLHRLRRSTGPRSLRPETLLLAGTGFGLLLLHLPFNQLNDTYIVDLLPFILLFVADGLRRLGARGDLLNASAALSAAMICGVALWMRGEYNWQQAAWQSNDALYYAGVAPADISTTYHWETYHGAFDDWLAVGNPGVFDDWLAHRGEQARYAVAQAPSPQAPPGWKLLSARSYRNVVFRKRYIITLQREPAS